MHGPLWLDNPTISVILLGIAFCLLYKSLTTEKRHRKHQHSNHYNVERELFGHKIVIQTKGGYYSHLL